MKKLGIVLSGGGARGFAHLGLLALLDEIGVRPDTISATSVGAVIAALYAVGKTPEQILQLLKKNNYFGWSNLALNGSGLFSMDVLRSLLETEVITDDFAALPVPLHVAVTDLQAGEPVIFSEGKLFHTIIASASIPVLFKPVLVGGRVLVDGGLLNNFPIEPLVMDCEVIIGSHVNRIGTEPVKSSLFKTFNILERCFHLAIREQVTLKKELCTAFIEPDLAPYDMYDIKQAEKIFGIGYECARQQKDVITRALEQGIINKKSGEYDLA